MEDTKVEEGFKRCSKCGEVKPISEFYKRKSSKDGLSSYCKECAKAYYAKHRGEILKKLAEWRAKNPTYNAEYNAIHKAERKAYFKAYSKAYTDPILSPLGWAKHMVAMYRKMDRDRGFDDSQTITAEWFLQNIAYKPCAHCGLLQAGAIGVNRMKNTEGHIPSNCEPCCFKCNARENIRDQLERGIHTSQLMKKQPFKEFVNEHKAKDKNLT